MIGQRSDHKMAASFQGCNGMRLIGFVTRNTFTSEARLTV